MRNVILGRNLQISLKTENVETKSIYIFSIYGWECSPVLRSIHSNKTTKLGYYLPSQFGTITMRSVTLYHLFFNVSLGEVNRPIWMPIPIHYHLEFRNGHKSMWAYFFPHDDRLYELWERYGSIFIVIIIIIILISIGKMRTFLRPNKQGEIRDVVVVNCRDVRWVPIVSGFSQSEPNFPQRVLPQPHQGNQNVCSICNEQNDDHCEEPFPKSSGITSRADRPQRARPHLHKFRAICDLCPPGFVTGSHRRRSRKSARFITLLKCCKMSPVTSSVVLFMSEWTANEHNVIIWGGSRAEW